MEMETRLRYLRIALVVVGLIFVFGIYPLTLVWPEGWMWEPRQYEYEQMIIGLYAVLGIFLLIASRDPMAHRSLIWFTVVSSVVHAAIMAAQATVDPAEHANFAGDIPALLLVAVILAALMPKRRAAGART